MQTLFQCWAFRMCPWEGADNIHKLKPSHDHQSFSASALILEEAQALQRLPTMCRELSWKAYAASVRVVITELEEAPSPRAAMKQVLVNEYGSNVSQEDEGGWERSVWTAQGPLHGTFWIHPHQTSEDNILC